MKKAPIPINEKARQIALESYNILDTAPEEIFDDLTFLASQICQTPISLVSLIDGDRQWFKSKVGLDVDEATRDISFCGHVICESDLIEVEDAAKDERFADNPLVTEGLKIRFYAGFPLIDFSGHALGTLCVIDTQPKTLSKDQAESLKRLARQVVCQLEVRRGRVKLAEAVRLKNENDQLTNLMHAIQNLAHIGGWELDLDAMTPIWTEETYRIHGLEPGTSVNLENAINYYAEHERERISSFIQECINNKKAYDDEFEFYDEQGNHKWVRAYGEPILDAAGDVIRLRGFFQDVSQRKIMEMSLLQSSKMVALGEMAGGVAHEINNPLMIINACSEYLLEGIGNLDTVDIERFKKMTQRISTTVFRIRSIVDGLRRFSRESSQDGIESVAVSEIFELSLSFCKERFEINGVQVNTRVEKGLKVNCRKVELSQVILNLLNNAFHAVQSIERPKIELEAKVIGSHVKITVKDNGPGVPKSLQEKIMQPFFTTKPVGEGTGLGLSISKGIVEGINGQLILEKSSEEGSVFAIELVA